MNYLFIYYLIVIVTTYFGILIPSYAKGQQIGESVLSEKIKKTIVYKEKKSNKEDKKRVSNRPLYAEGEVIVRYKSGVDESQINHLNQTHSINHKKLHHSKRKNPIHILKSKQTTEQIIESLKNNSLIESLSPNYIREASMLPNDPRFDEQWGLHNTSQTGGVYDADIDAVEAWDISTGSSDIVIAVFDTGIDYTHSDLRDNLWVNSGEIPNDGIDNDGNGYIDDYHGYDFAADESGNNSSEIMDLYGHGTHVSGILGATGDDGFGITGVNWNVSIMMLKVFRPSRQAYQSDIIEAIDYVKEMKARGVNIVVVNASYAGRSGNQLNIMNTEIASLADIGIVFCAAAGNNGTDNDNPDLTNYPASYSASNIIAVAASDHNDRLISTSNYGATTVDIAAPGGEIWSTFKYSFSDSYEPQEWNPYFVNLEENTPEWHTSHSSTSQGDNEWYTITSGYHSATHAISDGLDDGSEYENNQFKTIQPKHSIDLRSMADDNLAFGFWAIIDLETDWDFLHVYFSANAGQSWEKMGSFTGKDTPMKAYSIKIPTAYQTQYFYYAFTLDTDSSVTAGGVSIDDIGIGVGSRESDQYMNWSATSMATPFVSGAIGLLASIYPNDSASTKKSRILNSVDLKSTLTGKVLTNGRLNISSAIYSYINPGEECSAGTRLIQGTLTCYPATEKAFSGIFPSDSCGVGERVEQGSDDVCVSGIAIDTFDPYLPTCSSGKLIQGSLECISE